MNFKDYIRDIENFPKQGVVFKDITPLLNDADILKKATKALLNLVNEYKIDKVVGIESRGFFFATLLSTELNAGFVPVRKKGKLPFTVLSKPYSLEYGDDAVEIHADAIQKHDRVLIHDDVLATGGTAKAVCELVEELGGKIIQCNFLIELDFLKGREQLAAYTVASLIHY